MKTAELRKLYLDYFTGQGHLLVPSSSLVPYKDPSVLLTTAGMQQFKPYFMGLAEPPAPRMASVQKCFRTSDIDKVGLTARHCTFFEMLGNFSIGDYFKEGAIRFAWEFSLDYLRLDKERIWISYFEGDDAIEADNEAIGYWTELGVPRERMVGLPRSANFWGPVGPSGPCGPCSELYYDRGPEYGCYRPRLPSWLRLRPLRRVLEPGLHGLQHGREPGAHPTARPEHRHGHGPRAHRRAEAERHLGVSHRRDEAAGRTGGGDRRKAVR